MKKISSHTLDKIHVYPTGAMVINKEAVGNLGLKDYHWATLYRDNNRIIVELAKDSKDPHAIPVTNNGSYLSFMNRKFPKTMRLEGKAKSFELYNVSDKPKNWLEFEY